MRILIYGGTTEGRELAQILQKAGLAPVVSVATEYGEETMQNADPAIRVREGRLDVEEMRELALSGGFDVVVDATHPYAVEVSRNIRESLSGTEIPLLRLGRQTDVSSDLRKALGGKLQVFDSAADCAETLCRTRGNILLTTGSKELAVFCEDPAVRTRIIARVLPGEESLRLCREAGLAGKQIIAMQGPFSVEMDLAVIHQYRIQILVTKASGKTGGTDEKLAAAAKAGIACMLIRQPEEEDGQQIDSLTRVLQKLSEMAGVEISGENRRKCDLCITLAGVGMGTKETMTAEVREAIAQADVVFGAPRLLHDLPCAEDVPCYAMYRPEEILDRIHMLGGQERNILILYSGDSGFQSGCRSMREALRKEGIPDHCIKTLAGISSLSYLSAAAGISWEDAVVVSLHGVAEEVWQQKLRKAMQYSRKIFFLAAGPQSVRQLGAFLDGDRTWRTADGNENIDDQNGDINKTERKAEIKIILGYQLSYPQQEIRYCSLEECLSVEKKGLYCGFLLFSQGFIEQSEGDGGTAAGRLLPGIPDAQFIRGKVPMTKEEIRILSLSRLQLQQGSVLYDIGSGTGSIAVEAALVPGISAVYAIEDNPEAVSLIRQNAAKFHASRVRIVEGTAPEIISARHLPAPTHAFIGGTKGKLDEILRTLMTLNPYMRIVLNAVTLETITNVQTALQRIPITDEDVTAVAISRAARLGHYHLMRAQNTVYIYSFELNGESAEKDMKVVDASLV